MGLLEYIKQEWDTLKGAPISFVVLLVLGLVAGFYGGISWNSQELANVRSALDAAQRHLDFKVDQLEDANRKLSEQQVSTLGSQLKKTPAAVEIIKPRANQPSGLSKQLEELFSDSGWQVTTQELQTPAQGVSLRTSNPADAETIARALAAARVEYEAITPASGDGQETYFQIQAPQAAGGSAD